MQLRRKLDQIADLAANADQMTPTMLRIAIQAIYEGREIPAEEGDFLKLAARAGVSRGQGGQEWKRLALIRLEPVTADRLAEVLAEARSLRVAAPPRMTALYRWYDDADRLLYVGISRGLPGRVADHVGGSSWMEFAGRAAIARYPSHEEALQAETAAIKAERPLFNRKHNDTPEAQFRLVEYLVEHKRADLLAPVLRRA